MQVCPIACKPTLELRFAETTFSKIPQERIRNSLIMDSKQIKTPFLENLQSSEQQSLLDEIDKLRSQGVNDFVPLPQIVVCGDQSSGKSSVLEAISGVPFPRSDVLCTRFATEVILRQSDETAAKVAVSIIPSQDATDSERAELNSFKKTISSLEDFPLLVEECKSAMGVAATGKAFSKNILRIEIIGPDKPKLTVVDLPGLIHAKNKDQSEADIQLISALIQSYIENPRSIILAVVSAKNDIANQAILDRARDVDPDGLRTLGLITKPDTLPRGSESEAQFLQLAGNTNIFFRLGWHVVRNRDYESRDSTTEQRDLAESLFFEEDPWKDLPRSTVGVGSLRSRLSQILLNQIRRHLPNLIDDIRRSMNECRSKLEKLGDNRDTSERQRNYLLKMSQSFQDLCREAVGGNYDDAFFGDPSSNKEYYKRIRAVTQNGNIEFSSIMKEKGHHRKILEDDAGLDEKDTATEADGQLIMSQKEAVKWVRQLLIRSRGRELPGSFNPLLVSELFRDQSSPWEKLAREHVKKMWEESKRFLDALLSAIMDEETVKSLLTRWIDPKTKQRYDQACQMIDRLVNEKKRHPITYNHYYTETLQRLRVERQERMLESSLRKAYNMKAGTGPSYDFSNMKVSNFSAILAKQSGQDMDQYACLELLDSMKAYYKVSFQYSRLNPVYLHQSNVI